jgi:translation initiation factor 2B subunit (eIF-2B alpha/beta/delta family)
MPERRLDHVRELETLGLAPPDDATMRFLWQIVDEGVLGASRHVQLANQLVLHLIDQDDSGLRRARLVVDFIARTRGHDTPVIGNSLNLLLAGLDEVPADQQVETLKARVASWDKAAAARKASLVETAVRHLSAARGIMAFDYSSTVSAIVIALAEQNRAMRIVVPESRAIAGGARYLEEFLPRGLQVDFLPDAAIEYGLAKCDAAIFGIETLRADGSFLNTIGSRMVARLAIPMGVEIYGASDLMKLDRRSYSGHRPSLSLRAYDSLLKGGLAIEGLELADTTAPELEVIPAALTTALLTEHGVVPPSAIWALGRQVFGMDEASR